MIATIKDLLLKFLSEPDYFRSCAYGLPFIMKRNWHKAWCGYVGVPANHPCFGRLDLILPVHGGVTWTAYHVPGEPSDGYWYFGFDCSHSYDLSPSALFLSAAVEPWGRTYRTFEFARRECFSLAEALSHPELLS